MAGWRYGDWNATALPSATLAGLATPSKPIVEHHSERLGGARDRAVVTADLKNRGQGKRRLNQFWGWRS